MNVGKQPSRSDKLIADMHRAALTALSESLTGSLRKSELLREVEKHVTLDEWAKKFTKAQAQPAGNPSLLLRLWD